MIVGNVDGARRPLPASSNCSGIFRRAKLPARDPVHLQPLHAATYHETSDQPFTAVLLGYRMPGYDSPDYAAAQILGDVLNNQRSTFGALPFTGKALGVEFDEQTFTKAGIGIAFAAVPVTSKPQDVDAEIRGIINNYRTNGVPADLVEAAKLREVSELEFNGNSIEGLADEWSQAVAVQGLGSPDDMIAHFKNVSAADVNRVLRTYLNNYDRGRCVRRSEECRRGRRRRFESRRRQFYSAEQTRAVAELGAIDSGEFARSGTNH